MGRNQTRRRNNAAPRAAAALESELHKEWASSAPRSFCERHIGDAHAPRCADCNQAEVVAAAERVDALLVRYVPGSHCPLHPGYPLPCNACARDQLANARGEVVA
jgi:hypothetical protein